MLELFNDAVQIVSLPFIPFHMFVGNGTFPWFGQILCRAVTVTVYLVMVLPLYVTKFVLILCLAFLPILNQIHCCFASNFVHSPKVFSYNHKSIKYNHEWRIIDTQTMCVKLRQPNRIGKIQIRHLCDS